MFLVKTSAFPTSVLNLLILNRRHKSSTRPHHRALTGQRERLRVADALRRRHGGGGVEAGVQAEQEVVEQHERRPEPEAHEAGLVERPQQEHVERDRQRRHPRHQRHAPRLRPPQRRQRRVHRQRREEPDRSTHGVHHVPAPVHAPVRRDRDRGRDDRREVEREQSRVPRGGFVRHVVAADEERDRHEEEDEEGGHRQEVAEDGKIREEPDHCACEDHGRGGVDGGLGSRAHAREPGRDEVRSRDVGEVARLADGGDEEDGGDAFEGAQGDDVLRPVPADVGECDGERRAFVDLGVGHHERERERHHHVDEGADEHGADEADGDVARRVLDLLCHGGDRVEAEVGEEEHRGRAEDPPRAEVEEVVCEVVRIGVRQARDDDERDDEHVDDGRDPVHVGRPFRAPDCEQTCQHNCGIKTLTQSGFKILENRVPRVWCFDVHTHEYENGNRDGVEQVVALAEIGVDAELVAHVGPAEDERCEVGCEPSCDGRATDNILQDDVACADECHEIAELHSQ